ncbi:DHA2 family efflux MFS transporter permease subunit [Pseudonocardia pini]|uniref:DHA2 family efflux MFS transporter permease subunit n=1 Tax=Pseudonocardia pini TaxID=2758030 RepID=UPI0028B0127D|nr:DHA2 family efflux MFS transporter permease subunit [Pseudonocardia pini]
MNTTESRIDAPLVRTAFILVLGTFMSSLDATIVTVGIDTMAQDLNASVTEIQWVTTAYLLAVVAVVPASGWLVDRIGGRRTWMGAIVVFLAGSLLCALSWSVESMIVFRVIQGLGGGLLPPTGQTLLARAAGPSRIGRIISIVGMVPLLTPLLGPVAAGGILAAAPWPWLFYVNLPIGLVAVVLATRFVDRDAPAGSDVPFDVVGAALLSPGLAFLMFGLTGLAHIETSTTPALSIGAIVVGAGMLVGFVVHGLRHHAPLLDPRMFTRPPLGAAALALVILGASVVGTLFLLPLYLQTARGLTPWGAALLMVPQGIGAILASLTVSRIIDRVAPRAIVITGVGLIALGSIVLTQVQTPPPDALLAASLFVRGLGIAMIGAPVMTIVYSTIDRAEVPRASTALNLLNTIGGSLGTAVLAVILQNRLDARGPDLAAAFADSFWWVLGFCLVAAVGVVRLPRRPRRPATP